MKDTRLIMGMPITIDVVDNTAQPDDLEQIFRYFNYVDEKFSPYKASSELSFFNQGRIKPRDFSPDMAEIWRLSEITKKDTNGYFDIQRPDGSYNPSGLVKGWAIYQAAELLRHQGFKNYYVAAGGDIQVSGSNYQAKPWTVGIRNPFKPQEIIKILTLNNQGIATSGTYERGQHIYNPKLNGQPITDIISLTVVGPNVFEADRFATAAFAMGKAGINFIEQQFGLEGYLIDKQGLATLTSGLSKYFN